MSAKRPLVLFGISRFAELACALFRHDSDYDVVAFTVDRAYASVDRFCDAPVIPFEELSRRHPPGAAELFVAVGHHQVNAQRAEVFGRVREAGYRLARFVSPRADVFPDLQVGENSMVMDRAGIQPDVRIGDDTIVWSHTHIGFGCRVGDHCWMVCPILGEAVSVGDRAFLGINATIAPGVRIAERTVVGAGALITRHTQPDEVYRGVASRPSKVPSYRLPKF